MDTISIIPEATLNSEGQEKKDKVSGKAKAAMAAGVAGMAAGVGATELADLFSVDNGNNDDDEKMTVADSSDNNPACNSVVETEMQVVAETEVVAEVNPDDVILEEPVAEEDLIAEAQVSEAYDYQPFAINDVVEGDPMPYPMPDDILAVGDEDVIVDPIENPGDYTNDDLFCGWPQDDELPIDVMDYMDEELHAEGDETDLDIPTDLLI